MTHVYKEIVRTAKYELSDKFNKYMQITKERTTPVELKGRKHIKVDLKATQKKLEERLNRFCIQISSIIDIDRDPVSIVYHGVCFTDNEFRLINITMALSDTRSMSDNLMIKTSDMRISHHAIERWLERNESSDYKEALFQLGKSLLSAHFKILSKLLLDNKEVYGYQERYVKCDDGGYSVVKIENPEAKYLRYIEATIVTYISEGMVKDWNEKKAKSEFDNLYDFDTGDIIPAHIAKELKELIDQDMNE